MIFGALHLIALALGALLFVMFLRADRADIPPPDEEEGGGGGGNDRISPSPQSPPSGGIPLLDAEPADTRLRSHGDKLRTEHERREVRHPSQPQRTPAKR